MNKANTYINYNINMEATGKNIRTFMKIAGYSAKDFAEYIGGTEQTFFNWQAGKNLPSFDNLLRLSGILKVPIEKIVVFQKRDDEIPLKSTNSGFIRNSVFFTYNNATQCMLRDCIAFNKKFGVFPDKLILNQKTFDNWIESQNKKSEADADSIFDSAELPENMNARLEKTEDGLQIFKTDKFKVEFIFNDRVPEDYYRLINERNCCLS